VDDKKDQRQSAVPLGTFRPSSVPAVPPPQAGTTKPPPPPAAALKPREDDTVQTRVVRSSIASVPPVAGTGEAERKRVRTLVGVPTPPPGALAAGKGNYPAPPKWKKPSQRDDEPTVRDAAIAVPVARIELKPASNRPQPPAPPAAPDAPISDTIQQMLDEQTSVTMEIEDAPPAFTLPHEAEMPQPSAAARRSSNPPVMLPEHVAVAHAREAEQVEEQIARRSSMPPEPLFATPSTLALDTDMLSSSLAPAEVRAPVRRDDRAPGLGFAFVGVMTVVFVAGWFATAGGYKQTHPRPEVASASTAAKPAAAAQPVAPPPAPKPAPAAPTVAPPPAPAAPEVPAQELGAVAAPAAKPAPAPTPAPARAAAPKPAAPAARVVRPSEAPVARPAPRPVEPIVKISKVDEPPAAVAVTPAPVEEENLPETPSREDVLQRIEALRPVVSACAEGQKGIAELDITIASSGNITTVLVGGDFAGTPQGSCIARSVRQARLPKFKKDRFRLLYPFSL
jgi:hypothetical protein